MWTDVTFFIKDCICPFSTKPQERDKVNSSFGCLKYAVNIFFEHVIIRNQTVGTFSLVLSAVSGNGSQGGKVFKPSKTWRCWGLNLLHTYQGFCPWATPLFLFVGVSPPTNLSIHPLDIGEDHVILYWKLPQEGHGSYIQVKPSAAIAKSMTFFSNTERFKIEFLIPGMTYEIGVASVTNGNKSDLKTIHCTLSKLFYDRSTLFRF